MGLIEDKIKKNIAENNSDGFNAIIDDLKNHRGNDAPEIDDYKNQLDPAKHDVFDPSKRPDKWVKVDPDDPNSNSDTSIEQDAETGTINVTSTTTAGGTLRREKVARVAIAIQKLIVKRAVSFLFGNPVELDAKTENENQKTILKAIERVMFDVKAKSHNRRIARTLFTSTEVAELWFPVERKSNIYGFESKFKLRTAILSPILGDKLYPYFDNTGDMIAFSREFSVSSGKKSTTYFETYTEEFIHMWTKGDKGFEYLDGFPKKNVLGKIPIVYASQPLVEWADVQNLIDRLEKLLSNFADTNDYHASPKIFVKGEIKGFAKKGESGAIIQGDENSSANYLSWENAPESVKLEISTLLNLIYTITQTPDISFESVKGLGTISGVALKLLFMDAHLKVMDHMEVFDDFLQRRLNVVKAFIGKFNTQLEKEAESLIIESIVTPYMVIDEAAELKIWSDANGGNAIMSQKASFMRSKLTSDPEADFEQYQKEQESARTFSFNEPTV